MKHTVAVLGEGAWGTAIATVLAHNGHKVNLWCNDPHVVETIRSSRVNQRYMPYIELSPLIFPTASIEEALKDVTIVFEVSPVKYMRSVLTKAKSFAQPTHCWVSLSKGIENKTLMLPTQIIEDVIGASVKQAVCLGPSFADEVVRQKFTSILLATKNSELSILLKQLLESDYFKVYESSDIIGPQVGAALKNVIALGVGILEGAGYGENAKAYVLTKALQDMVSCVQALGGQKETVYGLSGLGDLVLTCMGGLSRNVMVGRYFGQGQSLEKVIEETGTTPEGVNTVQSIFELAQKYNIILPVCQGIYDMVFQDKSVSQFLHDLS